MDEKDKKSSAGRLLLKRRIRWTDNLGQGIRTCSLLGVYS